MANKPTSATTKVDAGQTDPQEGLPKASANDTPQASALADAGKREEGDKPGEDYAVPGVDPSAVEKVTVKTTGDFNLQDPFTLAVIDANSDGVEVVKTSFIADKIAAGQLEEA